MAFRTCRILEFQHFKMSFGVFLPNYVLLKIVYYDRFLAVRVYAYLASIVEHFHGNLDCQRMLLSSARLGIIPVLYLFVLKICRIFDSLFFFQAGVLFVNFG